MNNKIKIPIIPTSSDTFKFDCLNLLLGDIVIAYETVKKESLAQKKKFHEHLTHLILHSILHLIGFDHEDEKMAKIMENLEIKILKTLKIQNPYQQNH